MGIYIWLSFTDIPILYHNDKWLIFNVITGELKRLNCQNDKKSIIVKIESVFFQLSASYKWWKTRYSV